MWLENRFFSGTNGLYPLRRVPLCALQAKRPEFYAQTAIRSLPVLIEIVDSEDRIRGFVPQLDEMVKEGLVTLETVEIIAYRAGSPKA